MLPDSIMLDARWTWPSLTSTFYNFLWLTASVSLPMLFQSAPLLWTCVLQFCLLLSLIISYSASLTFCQASSNYSDFPVNRWLLMTTLHILKQNWDCKNIVLIPVCSIFSLFPSLSWEWDSICQGSSTLTISPQSWVS